MITVIAEYTALVTAKARMNGARHALQFRPRRLFGPAQDVVDGTNRALGEARAQITAAIDNLVQGNVGTPADIAHQLHARTAFAAIDTHAGAVADLDAMLAAASTLPADVDVDYAAARLRSERELALADLTRNTAVLVHALADARLDVTGDTPEQRCPECGGLRGAHSTVHARYPEGGGGVNRPCSRMNGTIA